MLLQKIFCRNNFSWKVFSRIFTSFSHFFAEFIFAKFRENFAKFRKNISRFFPFARESFCSLETYSYDLLLYNFIMPQVYTDLNSSLPVSEEANFTTEVLPTTLRQNKYYIQVGFTKWILLGFPANGDFVSPKFPIYHQIVAYFVFIHEIPHLLRFLSPN